MKQWEVEPDSMSFEHMGLKCEIIRRPQGHLCGYVYLPESNIYYGIDEFELNTMLKTLEEITYSDYDGVYWKVGFAFARASDYVPKIIEEDEKQFEKDLLKNAYEMFNFKYPTEDDYRGIEQAIDIVKNFAEVLSKK